MNAMNSVELENHKLNQIEIDAGVELVRGWLDELDMWFASVPGEHTVILDCPVPFDKLNAVVCNLAFTTTKRKPNVSGPWFRTVNRKWPSLRLVKRITNIVTRACKKIKVRPLVRVLALQSEFGEKAVLELCNHCLHMAGDPSWTCETIDWQSYEKILLRAQSLIRGENRAATGFTFRLCSATNRGSTALMAYVAFLELAHADAVWCATFNHQLHALEQFIRGTLSDSIELLEKIARHRGSQLTVPQHTKLLSEMKTDHQRSGVAKRQRRFRERQGKAVS